MLFLFGVLASLVYGKDTTVKKDYLKFISILTSPVKALWFTILSRLIILFMTGLVLFAISLLSLLLFNGVNLFSTSFPTFLVFTLSLLFFFCMGAVIGLIEKQIIRALVSIAAYIFLAILLPLGMGFAAEISAKDLPSLIEFNFKNFSVVMNEEEKWGKKYDSSEFKENSSEEEIKEYEEIMRKMKKTFRDNEEILRKQSLQKIKKNQSVASFLPTLFYFSVCESNSSICVISQIEFNTYCQEIKEEFVDFIIEKEIEESYKKKEKTDSKKTQMENFIKGDDDLFFSKPKLPHSFLSGVICTLLYSMVMLLITYKFLMKSLINEKPKKTYAIENEDYNPVFSLCGNPGIKADIVDYYRGKERTVVLEKINTRDFNGIKPHELFSHLCNVNGIDEKKARENLSLLGIRDFTGLSCDEEIIMKIYAAVRTAVDFDMIILDEFLNKESREFENDVFRLLLAIEKAGKKIIYLSLHMKQQRVRYPEESIEVDEYATFPLNFRSNSVR